MYECVLFTYPRLVASARGVNGNRGTEKSTESVVRVLCKCAWSERVHYYDSLEIKIYMWIVNERGRGLHEKKYVTSFSKIEQFQHFLTISSHCTVHQRFL